MSNGKKGSMFSVPDDPTAKVKTDVNEAEVPVTMSLGD